MGFPRVPENREVLRCFKAEGTVIMIDNHSYRNDGFPFVTVKGHTCMDSGFALVFHLLSPT